MNLSHGLLPSTFRARLVLAVAFAVVLAVVLGSIAAFVVSRNSLVGSLDVTLGQSAQGLINEAGSPTQPQFPNECSSGSCVQIVNADGNTFAGTTRVLPVTDQVREVAGRQGQGPPIFFSTTVRGVNVRQAVLPISPGYYYNNGNQFGSPYPAEVEMVAGGALQLTYPLTGVNRELGHLAVALWAIILGGVIVAVALGMAVARAVLRPLNSLTGTIEELAQTTDVSRRLDPGGVDELGRLRRAFNRLLAALDSSRESQRQLVLDASHELRTPLTSLHTNMEVARRMEELAPEEREVLIDDVLTQLDELTAVVADLAELARGEIPHQVAEPVPFDTVVDEAVAVATTHGRNRGVTFTMSATPSWVLGSRSRLERAVGNLLDNALKWSPDDGIVEVECHRGAVIVRDHGPGIAAEDIIHIFDRFYRAPSARGLPGSGLGLAIVAQVAREEGGMVEAHNAEGGGALFRFSLPVVDPPSGADEAAP